MAVSTAHRSAVFVKVSKSMNQTVSYPAIDLMNADNKLKKTFGMRNLVSVLTAPTYILNNN